MILKCPQIQSQNIFFSWGHAPRPLVLASMPQIKGMPEHRYHMYKITLQKMYAFPIKLNLWKDVGNTIFPHGIINFPKIWKGMCHIVLLFYRF